MHRLSPRCCPPDTKAVPNIYYARDATPDAYCPPDAVPSPMLCPLDTLCPRQTPRSHTHTHTLNADPPTSDHNPPLST